MTQTTDSPYSRNDQGESEFSPDFIRLLVALTVATLVVVFAFEHRVLTSPGSQFVRVYLYPWVVAGGHTISNGLSEFSGKSPSELGLVERAAVLLGLLFGFVIGPTLFLFGWRNRRQERETGSKTSALKGSAVISVLGAILTFAVAIPSIPVAYIQVQVSNSLHHAQALQDNKDQMINDLNMIAYNARQFRILPKNLEGGAGSYIGYIPPSALANTENGTYTVTCTADEITANAFSNKYSDCHIGVKVDKAGAFVPSTWVYTGEFE